MADDRKVFGLDVVIDDSLAPGEMRMAPKRPPDPMLLNDALEGRYGADIQEKAEEAMKAATDQIARMVAEGTIVGAVANGAAKGGFVSPNAAFMIGNGDRERMMPHSVGFDPKVVIEDPDGRLHGNGNVIVSAHASAWRPQDCAPALRRVMFGDKR